jgi:hypothetical protein
MLPGWLVPLVEKHLPEGYSLREDYHFVYLCFSDHETGQVIGQWSWPGFTLQGLEGSIRNHQSRRWLAAGQLRRIVR